MAKRPNPWASETPQQLKTHIGKQEIAAGVDGAQIQKEIYEHTKTLMTQGAKQYYSKPSYESPNQIEVEMNGSQLHGQMDITAFIKGFKPCAKEVNNNNQRTKQTNCKTCQGENVIKTCSFCDHMTCENCLRSCNKCNGFFCSLCAIPSYSDKNDSAHCLNCVE